MALLYLPGLLHLDLIYVSPCKMIPCEVFFYYYYDGYKDIL